MSRFMLKIPCNIDVAEFHNDTLVLECQSSLSELPAPAFEWLSVKNLAALEHCFSPRVESTKQEIQEERLRITAKLVFFFLLFFLSCFKKTWICHLRQSAMEAAGTQSIYWLSTKHGTGIDHIYALKSVKIFTCWFRCSNFNCDHTAVGVFCERAFGKNKKRM